MHTASAFPVVPPEGGTAGSFNFVLRSFEFVSNFVLRISNFWSPASNPTGLFTYGKKELLEQSRYSNETFFRTGCLLLGILLATVVPGWASADSPNDTAPVISEKESTPSDPWYREIELEWGGHLKVRGSASRPDDESIFQTVGTRTYYDGNVEGRITNMLFFSEWGYVETHYEAVLSGGDTRRKGRELEQLFPDLFRDGVLISQPPEDSRRLMDLTKTVDESSDYLLYHRLDRLSLTLLPQWGVVRIGRQAVTWGNGLLFNPMDLLNPFAPTDIERDYKIGDDLVATQFSVDGTGDVQFLYVPRRDPSSGDVEWDRSSLAGKLHCAVGTTEFDIMAARHYRDEVVGLGSRGYLGDAAWRVDATWTFLHEGAVSDDYLSLVANMDYSWVWWKKNFYGFLEFFYNGLGDDQYTEAFSNPDISERLERGELFTLGRTYLSGHIRVELHPLFNVYLTLINNVADPSGTLQPRAAWDVTQDVQVTFGASTSYGEKGTEYGGFGLPGTNFTSKAPNSGFLWLTYFF